MEAKNMTGPTGMDTANWAMAWIYPERPSDNKHIEDGDQVKVRLKRRDVDGIETDTFVAQITATGLLQLEPMAM